VFGVFTTSDAVEAYTPFKATTRAASFCDDSEFFPADSISISARRRERAGATPSRASVRRTSRRAPDEIDKTNKFPRDLWPKLGELGVLGITVRGGVRRRGGSAISSIAWRWREISRGSGRESVFLTARIPIFASIRSGAMRAPEQKMLYLPKLVSGETSGARWR